MNSVHPFTDKERCYLSLSTGLNLNIDTRDQPVWYELF